MAVAWQLGEVLTGGKGLRLAAVDGALDRSLENRGVDERGLRMCVSGAVLATPPSASSQGQKQAEGFP